MLYLNTQSRRQTSTHAKKLLGLSKLWLFNNAHHHFSVTPVFHTVTELGCSSEETFREKKTVHLLLSRCKFQFSQTLLKSKQITEQQLRDKNRSDITEQYKSLRRVLV